jgi:hypothetical protein
MRLTPALGPPPSTKVWASPGASDLRGTGWFRYGRRPLPPSADRRPYRSLLPRFVDASEATNLRGSRDMVSPARGRREPRRNADHPATQILPSSSPQSGRSQRPLSRCARRTPSATREGRTAGPGLASFFPSPGKGLGQARLCRKGDLSAPEIRLVQSASLAGGEARLAEYLDNHLGESALLRGNRRRCSLPPELRANVLVQATLRASDLVRTAMQVAYLIEKRFELGLVERAHPFQYEGPPCCPTTGKSPARATGS